MNFRFFLLLSAGLLVSSCRTTSSKQVKTNTTDSLSTAVSQADVIFLSSGSPSAGFKTYNFSRAERSLTVDGSHPDSDGRSTRKSFSEKKALTDQDMAKILLALSSLRWDSQPAPAQETCGQALDAQKEITLHKGEENLGSFVPRSGVSVSCRDAYLTDGSYNKVESVMTSILPVPAP